jgi:lysophospholipase L1-like esterase
MRRSVQAVVAGIVVLLAMLGPAQAARAAPPPLPDSIAAIGDSITQAVDVCCFYGAWPSHSWATGYVPFDGISSHYERIRTANPAIRGHRYNDAVSGARMADAPGQAREAVEQRAQYVTILMGANDLCGWNGSLTPAADFRAQFTETMEILQGLPAGAHMFVASIPNLYQLWSILHTDPLAQAVWQVAGICPAMLRLTNSAADRQLVVDREREFNAILAEVCGRHDGCRFDDLRVYNFQFTREMVSKLDYFHPSLEGQAVLAAETWRASWWGS